MSRMLVMMLRTVTVIAAWRRCSTSAISSAVVPCAASRSFSQASAGVTAGSWSRSRCTSSTANAVTSRGLSSRDMTAATDRTPRPLEPEQLVGERVGLAGAPRARATIASASRRRFSTSTTRSEIVTAQSSPIVSGCTRLVGAHETAQRLRIEAAVGVRDEGPRDAVHARIAGERSVGERRQLPVEAQRQIVADLAQLLVDDEEVVEQPLGGRRDPAFLARRPRPSARFASRSTRPFSSTRGSSGALRLARRW